MRLVQLTTPAGERAVAQVEADQLRLIEGYETLYALATAAIAAGSGLEPFVHAKLSSVTLSYDDAVADRRLLPPADHPDDAHCLVTGTGLTHLGSAESRDAMHSKLAETDQLTDSMKVFKDGRDRC